MKHRQDDEYHHRVYVNPKVDVRFDRVAINASRVLPHWSTYLTDAQLQYAVSGYKLYRLIWWQGIYSLIMFLINNICSLNGRPNVSYLKV